MIAFNGRLALVSLAALVVVLLTSAGAQATHPIHPPVLGYAANPTTVSAIADTTAKFSTDDSANPPRNLTLHLSPGHVMAHANDLTSPLPSPPTSGDTVGSISVWSDPAGDGCGNPVSATYPLTWWEPISSGAPAGTVAELRLVTPFASAVPIRAWVVLSKGDGVQAKRHYELVFPQLAGIGTPLCHISTAGAAVTIFGYASTVNPTFAPVPVQRNPDTTGVKPVFAEYKTASGARVVVKTTYTITP